MIPDPTQGRRVIFAFYLIFIAGGLIIAAGVMFAEDFPCHWCKPYSVALDLTVDKIKFKIEGAERHELLGGIPFQILEVIGFRQASYSPKKEGPVAGPSRPSGPVLPADPSTATIEATAQDDASLLIQPEKIEGSATAFPVIGNISVAGNTKLILAGSSIGSRTFRATFHRKDAEEVSEAKPFELVFPRENRIHLEAHHVTSRNLPEAANCSQLDQGVASPGLACRSRLGTSNRLRIVPPPKRFSLEVQLPTSDESGHTLTRRALVGSEFDFSDLDDSGTETTNILEGTVHFPEFGSTHTLYPTDMVRIAREETLQIRDLRVTREGTLRVRLEGAVSNISIGAKIIEKAVHPSDEVSFSFDDWLTTKEWAKLVIGGFLGTVYLGALGWSWNKLPRSHCLKRRALEWFGK